MASGCVSACVGVCCIKKGIFNNGLYSLKVKEQAGPRKSEKVNLLFRRMLLNSLETKSLETKRVWIGRKVNVKKNCTWILKVVMMINKIFMVCMS
jgi:hypothetical protein